MRLTADAAHMVGMSRTTMKPKTATRKTNRFQVAVVTLVLIAIVGSGLLSAFAI